MKGKIAQKSELKISLGKSCSRLNWIASKVSLIRFKSFASFLQIQLSSFYWFDTCRQQSGVLISQESSIISVELLLSTTLWINVAANHTGELISRASRRFFIRQLKTFLNTILIKLIFLSLVFADWSWRRNEKFIKRNFWAKRTMRRFHCLPLQALLVLGIICSTNGAPYSSESISLVSLTVWQVMFTAIMLNRSLSSINQSIHYAVTNRCFIPEYGRTCKDIGCLPREVCVMAYESCSFSQQENVSCGRYPTCKKNTDQATQQNSGNLSWSHQQLRFGWGERWAWHENSTKGMLILQEFINQLITG